MEGMALKEIVAIQQDFMDMEHASMGANKGTCGIILKLLENSWPMAVLERPGT